MLIAEKFEGALHLIDTLNYNVVEVQPNQIPFTILRKQFGWNKHQITNAIKNITIM